MAFDDESFDVVVIGFCWFWTDRKYLMRAMAEADRVLKTGGYLAVYDFDTKNPYVRKNVHNNNVPTYKMDIASLFLANPQYYLVEKRSFNENGIGFNVKVQEREALNVFYKQPIEDSYIIG